MSQDKDVIEVALEVGRTVLMHAEGDPAKTLAYGVAAAVAAVGAGIAYGACKYGSRLLDWAWGD